jgi:hypothetical protein
VGGRRVQHDGHYGPDVVQHSGLSVECDDVVVVESRGKGGLGSERRSLMDDRTTAEDEVLRGGHLVVRAAPMAHSCSKARVAARSRSGEAQQPWMVAIAVINAEEAGGGADGEATTSVHVARAGKAGGDRDAVEQ